MLMINAHLTWQRAGRALLAHCRSGILLGFAVVGLSGCATYDYYQSVGAEVKNYPYYHWGGYHWWDYGYHHDHWRRYSDWRFYGRRHRSSDQPYFHGRNTVDRRPRPPQDATTFRDLK